MYLLFSFHKLHSLSLQEELRREIFHSNPLKHLPPLAKGGSSKTAHKEGRANSKFTHKEVTFIPTHESQLVFYKQTIFIVIIDKFVQCVHKINTDY